MKHQEMGSIDSIDVYDPDGPDALGKREDDFLLMQVWSRDNKTMSITHEQLQNAIDTADKSAQARFNLRTVASVLRAFANHLDMVAEGRKPS